MKDKPKQPPAPAPKPSHGPRKGNTHDSGRIQGGYERKIDPIYRLPDNPPPPPKK